MIDEIVVFIAGSAVLAILSVYCWLEIKKAYGRREILPVRVSSAIWILDTFHFALVILASVEGVWNLGLNIIIAIIIGSILIVVGFSMLLMGMLTFHSLRRISGMDSSTLIVKGIYRWSRNPQYTGWFLCLLGMSLIGRSGLSLLLTLLLILGIHLYNTLLEEPYLEKVFGNEYKSYKAKTARYFGVL